MLTLPLMLREALSLAIPGTSWIVDLATYGLRQNFTHARNGTTSNIWLFGGSPCWWHDQSAALPGPFPLVGFLIDQAGFVKLFQLESCARVTTLQAASIANAISVCPVGGKLKLDEIGLMTRPPASEVLAAVTRSIQDELILLVKRYEKYPSNSDIRQLKGWVTGTTSEFVSMVEHCLDSDCLPTDDDHDSRYRVYNAILRWPAEQRRLRAEAVRALPFIQVLQAWRPLCIRLTQAIFERAPLIQHIADSLSIPKWAIRAFRDAHKLEGFIAPYSPDNPYDIVKFLVIISTLDPNRLPETAAGWDYLYRIAFFLDAEFTLQLQPLQYDFLASGKQLPKKCARGKVTRA